MPRPWERQTRKVSDRAYAERWSFVRGAPARRGKRAGTPAPQARGGGGVGSGWRKWLPSSSTAPTDDQPWKRAEYTEELRRGLDGGMTLGTVHEAYGASLPGRLSRQKIRLRGRQGRPLSESARDSVGSGCTRGVRRAPNRDRVKTGLEREASNHTGGLAVYGDPTGRC